MLNGATCACTCNRLSSSSYTSATTTKIHKISTTATLHAGLEGIRNSAFIFMPCSKNKSILDLLLIIDQEFILFCHSVDHQCLALVDHSAPNETILR